METKPILWYILVQRRPFTRKPPEKELFFLKKKEQKKKKKKAENLGFSVL